MSPEAIFNTLKPALRPAIAEALAGLGAIWRGYPIGFYAPAFRAFVRARERFQSEWSRTPELGELARSLTDRRFDPSVRAEGCAWLVHFPSLETVATLAAIALDAEAPHLVRERAVKTLGSRELDANDDAGTWPADVVIAADAALLRIWRARPRGEGETLGELANAFRHVANVETIDAIAEDLVEALPALEAFASPALARRLVSLLAEIPNEHAARIVRLVGHVLGDEAIAPLLAYAEAGPFGPAAEALMTALSIDAARARPAVDRFLAGLKFDRVLRERAALHEANPGILFAPRALEVARVAATIPGETRRERCREAAGWLAALGRIEPFPEAYHFRIWRQLARLAGDDASILAAAESTGDALEHEPRLVLPYLDALARAGQYKKLASIALQHGAAAHATWELARRSRPFLALAARRAADGADPEAVAGEALALFFGGRPDLSAAVLEKTPPRAEALGGFRDARFPGLDERWRIAHEPERCGALVALAGGIPALLAAVTPPPEHAEADAFDFTLFDETERRIAKGSAGWSIDLPSAIDGTTRARFRRSICPTCGAPKSRPSATPFVYCDYCGALADFDLQSASEGQVERPGARYDRLAAELEPVFAQAIASGDREACRARQRELVAAWLEACPAAAPPRAREPSYRAAYVDYLAACATIGAFDETASLYARAVAEAARAVVVVSPSPGVWRATPASFDALWKVFSAEQAHLRRLFDERGVAATHPDASAEVQRLIRISTFVQTWLPKLEPAGVEALLSHAGLSDAYVEAEVVGTEASCGECGCSVPIFEGARCAVCEACGRRLDVLGRVSCAGCGAPLAPTEDATTFACPHCQNVMHRLADARPPGS